MSHAPPLTDRGDATADWLRDLATQLEAVLERNRHVRALGKVDVERLTPGLTDGAEDEYLYERAAVEFTVVVHVEPGQEYAAANELAGLAHHVRSRMRLNR